MTAWQTFLSRPRQLAARRWLFQVHLWTGVVTALYVIVASVTGSAVMFREEIQALVSPPPRADVERGEQAIGADAALTSLRGALDGYRVGSIVVPEEPGGAYGGYLLSRGRFAYAQVDPVTGAIDEVVTRENSWWRFVEDLHNNLLTGRMGRVVNGIGGISVALLCLTGLFIWWPGRGRWGRALHVGWSGRWPRLLWDLHGATGIWLLPLVFLIAVTGVYYTWPQSFRAGIAAVLPVAPREQPLRFADAKDQPAAPISRLLASAQRAVPGARVHSLQLPGDATQAVRAVMLRPGQRVMGLADAVLLHPTTAEVVRVDRHAERAAGDRVLRWIPALHAGHFAGVWSGTIWFLVGLAMAGLAGTGVAIWWNRVVRASLRTVPGRARTRNASIASAAGTSFQARDGR